MDAPLPTNRALVEFSQAISWQKIEATKQAFNELLETARQDTANHPLPLENFTEKMGIPITAHFDISQPEAANIILTNINDQILVLGCAVSHRYRSGKSLAQSIVPYNLNPGVNHTNIHETDDPGTRIRALGAELELGLLRRDGSTPGETEMTQYISTYQTHARRLGITPQVDREACQYQVEVHVAPGVGYHRTRSALDGIMTALMFASEATALQTAIMSCYPIETDFHLADDPKVQTAIDLMIEVNNTFPEYGERLKVAKERYNMNDSTNVVEAFRLQGCHIHLDLAGRSEALGLLTFYTMLRSATAIANSAVLKGGPFVNGTCDAELLCTREYLRRTTVTGRYIEAPLSPHLCEGHLERYGALLQSERVNAMARGLLYEDSLGSPISAMHNPVGRIRPDLNSSKRICTVESTGMPVNISASRQAAILTDFEFTHTLIEGYFRKYGCDLEPMYEDQTLWAIAGPLDPALFVELHNQSDRHCTDITLTTAAGTQMTLAEFYEMKRVYMHKHLADIAHIAPRDIDDVYHSLQRMLNPPSGQTAQTVEQYIHDYKLRSTGNWGQILRDAFIEEGGAPGAQNADAVLRVINRVHDSLRTRYLHN
jgi:hypothetical protein